MLVPNKNSLLPFGGVSGCGRAVVVGTESDNPPLCARSWIQFSNCDSLLVVFTTLVSISLILLVRVFSVCDDEVSALDCSPLDRLREATRFSRVWILPRQSLDWKKLISQTFFTFICNIIPCFQETIVLLSYN